MSAFQDEADEIIADYYAVRSEFNRLDPDDPDDQVRREELRDQYTAINRRYSRLKESAALAGKHARIVSAKKETTKPTSASPEPPIPVETSPEPSSDPPEPPTTPDAEFETPPEPSSDPPEPPTTSDVEPETPPEPSSDSSEPPTPPDAEFETPPEPSSDPPEPPISSDVEPETPSEPTSETPMLPATEDTFLGEERFPEDTSDEEVDWQGIYEQLDAEVLVSPDEPIDEPTPRDQEKVDAQVSDDPIAEPKTGPKRVTAKYKTPNPERSQTSSLDEPSPAPQGSNGVVVLTLKVFGWILVLVAAATISSLLTGLGKDSTLRFFERLNGAPLANVSYGLYASTALMGVGGMFILFAMLRSRALSRLPLHKLARNGNSDALERALEEGISPNISDATGLTALHHAVMARRREAVAVLVTHGADIEAQNDRGDTALYMATLNRDLGLVKYLVEKGGNIQTENRNGSSLMHVAASMGDVELLKFLEESGLDVQSRSMAGLMPLHFAVESGSVDAVEFLIESGVTPNADDLAAESPLCAAARLGHLKIVKILVAAGAKLEASEASQSPDPLAVASEHKHKRVVSYLRKQSKDD